MVISPAYDRAIQYK